MRLFSARTPWKFGWPIRFPRYRPPIAWRRRAAGGTATARGTQWGSVPRWMWTAASRRPVPTLGETIALEVRKQRVDDERLLFHCLGSRRALVGRHHLHLKHDEPLPVGRSRQTVG